MVTVSGSPGNVSHRQPVVSAPARNRSRIGPARVGQPHRPGVVDQSRQQPQQLGDVPRLVQHVGGDHQIPWRPGQQRLGLVEGADGGLHPHTVVGGVGGHERGRLRGQVGGQDPGAGQGGGDADQAEAAAQLEHAPTGQRLTADDPGQGDAAGPQLGPERQPVVARVVLGQDVVQDRVGVARPEHAHRAPPEHERLLDHVRRRPRRQPGTPSVGGAADEQRARNLRGHAINHRRTPRTRPSLRGHVDLC